MSWSDALRRLVGRPPVPPEIADVEQVERYREHLRAARRLRELEQGLQALLAEQRLIDQQAEQGTDRL